MCVPMCYIQTNIYKNRYINMHLNVWLCDGGRREGNAVCMTSLQVPVITSQHQNLYLMKRKRSNRKISTMDDESYVSPQHNKVSIVSCSCHIMHTVQRCFHTHGSQLRLFSVTLCFHYDIKSSFYPILFLNRLLSLIIQLLLGV